VAARTSNRQQVDKVNIHRRSRENASASGTRHISPVNFGRKGCPARVL